MDHFQVRSEWIDQKSQNPPQGPEFPGRRSFLMALIGIGTAFIGALLSIPLIRYTLHPLLAKTTKTSWFQLGQVSDFSTLPGPLRRIVKIAQVDGWREMLAERPVYITRGVRPGSQNGLEVLSSICPHLGCEVSWNDTRGQFVCPCHNSVFAADGSLVSGPAPRGMDTLPIKNDNGEIMVRFEYFRQLVPDKEIMG